MFKRLMNWWRSRRSKRKFEMDEFTRHLRSTYGIRQPFSED